MIFDKIKGTILHKHTRHVNVDKSEGGQYLHDHDAVKFMPEYHFFETEQTVLYNLYTAWDQRGIAPNGWKVPSQGDIFSFRDHIGADNAFKLKYIGINDYAFWHPNYFPGTNELKLNLIGGGRREANGSYSPTWAYASTSLFMYHEIVEFGANFFGEVKVSGFDNNIQVSGQVGNFRIGYAIRLISEFEVDGADGVDGFMTGNDGKKYRTVLINHRHWLAEDLQETKFRNGDLIPVIQNDLAWSAMNGPAMCIRTF